MKPGYFFLLGGAVAVASICSINLPAAAQTEAEEQAKSAFRLGRAYYDNGDFVKAAEEFEKAHRLSNKPELLYNVYLAYRDANMLREAATALRGYLTEVNEIPNRGQLNSRLEALERSLQEQAKNPQAQPPPPAAPPQPQPAAQPAEAAPAQVQPPPEQAAPPEAQPQPEQQPAAAAEKPKAKKLPIVPIVLMGAGGAMVVGSVITGIMASSAQSKLKKECDGDICPANLESTKTKGQTLAVVTDILLFGGIATAGAGVVLFILKGSEKEPAKEPAPVALGCGPFGCYGSVALAF